MKATINRSAAVPFSDIANLERLVRSPLPLPPQTLDVASAIGRELAAWAKDYPAVVHGRAGSILRWMPLCAAASYDGAPYPTALEFARHCVVAFAYDDLLDEETAEHNSLDVVHSLTREWLRTLENPDHEARMPTGSGTGSQQVLLALVDSMRRVMASPGALQHQQRWLELWEQVSNSMLQELAWRRRLKPQPDFEQYMHAAGSSIAVEATHWAAFMTNSPVSLLPEESTMLASTLKRAGYILRIANDLSTAERDQRNKAVNALPLAATLWSCSIPHAQNLLRQRLERELSHLFTAAADVTPAIADHYGWTVRSTVFACQWYLNRNELELNPEDF